MHILPYLFHGRRAVYSQYYIVLNPVLIKTAREEITFPLT